jgi:methionyl-tRNA formyltransferase
VPVNWAILHGERETGATLHVMNEKPDNGAIVAQQAVPILPDDTAIEVFRKVTCAAEMCLDRALPALLAGKAALLPQDLRQGAYFGGRKAEDGKIDWSHDARRIHNLVRAVAPPYPGAFTRLAGLPLRILKTRVELQKPGRAGFPAFFCENGRFFAECADGSVLRVLDFNLDGKKPSAQEFLAQHGEAPQPFDLDF